MVYLRQWRATGEEHAKEQAYQLLRGLTYLQTLTGPKAGEVVLWMQPDGTVNPSPLQPDSPNPSDSDASYWLARTLWALGEGYAAFRHADPDFAAFLKTRMDLSVAALQRDVLGRYGTDQIIHGVRVPDWLIVNGADASSEASLGLTKSLGLWESQTWGPILEDRGSQITFSALARSGGAGGEQNRVGPARRQERKTPRVRRRETART